MHRVDVVGAFVERDWCLCDASRCDSWCWRGCWCGAFAVRVGAGVAQSAMLDWCRLGAGLVQAWCRTGVLACWQRVRAAMRPWLCIGIERASAQRNAVTITPFGVRVWGYRFLRRYGVRSGGWRFFASLVCSKPAGSAADAL